MSHRLQSYNLISGSILLRKYKTGQDKVQRGMKAMGSPPSTWFDSLFDVSDGWIIYNWIKLNDWLTDFLSPSGSERWLWRWCASARLTPFQIQSEKNGFDLVK